MNVVAVPAWVAATNAYIVFADQDERAFLVDIPPDPVRVGSVVEELGLTVGAVLLTHGHIDHSGGAGEFSLKHGSEVMVHPDDDFLTLQPQVQLERMFGMAPPGSYNVPEEMSALSHDQSLDLAGFDVRVIHTPGHTPGHCCFEVVDEGTLFSGDQLFAGSIGRTDLPGGSMEQLIESMRTRVLTFDDDVRVLPGHGSETTIGVERRSNPFLVGL